MPSPERTAARVALAGIAASAVLAALKTSVGLAANSVATVSDGLESAADVISSGLVYLGLRVAAKPADADHPYGHEKVENLAANFEGILILIGAGIIVYEATHRLAVGSEVESLGIGIAVMAFSMFANLGVSGMLSRTARRTDSPALEGDAAHLRTDALTSGGVLIGLALVEITGAVAFDSITALVVAVAIVWSGIRIIRRSSGVLVDEALPEPEMDRVEAAIAAARTPEVAGYHKLRGRRAGSRRWVDLHVQFRSGTSLERAHEVAHRMRDEIEAGVPGAEVLIHVEPETSLREPKDGDGGPFRSG